MRKKDYELIAEVLRYADQENWTDHIELIAEEMADTLENANPKFDRQKFLTACGIEVDGGMTKPSPRLEKRLDAIIYED